MRTYSLISLAIVLLLSSCSNYKKVQRVKTLQHCEYRIAKAKDFNLVGIKLDRLASIDALNPILYARIIQALSSGGFPLEFSMVMEVKNPTRSTAELVYFEYDLYVDGVRWAKGVSESTTLIPGNGQVTQVPVPVSVNLGRLFKLKSLAAIKKMLMNTINLADNPTHFDVQLRPKLELGKKSYTPKEPIWVSTAFTSETGKKVRQSILN